MTCEECQDLISVFLDNELDESASVSFQTHLSLCTECAKICEDFAVLLATCNDTAPTEIVPPNSKALWCRINNLIEAELKPAPKKADEPPKSWFRRGWNFTFSQVGAAVIGIAIISSLLTLVGVRNYLEPAQDNTASSSTTAPSTFEKILGKVGLAETPQQARDRHLEEQREAIEYWTRRVHARRAQWDSRMREAFDRNLFLIDESVGEYTRILQQNPDDELSGEMLDAALDEKVNLLRAFAEL